MHKRVKDMPRRQQKAIFSNMGKPSSFSKASTRSDIRNIHRSSDNSVNAKNRYDNYKADINNHMDQTETKQYHKQHKKELKQEIKENKRAEKEELEKQNNETSQGTNTSPKKNSYEG